MTTYNIAVISDVHGNADALNYVLKSIKQLKIDLTIVLGDLLTYGCQPNEVIDILSAYKDAYPCIFIKGNHEEFYFNKGHGKNYKMPDFVKESVDWTAKSITGKSIEKIFEWKESFIFENILFSHANPYEYGNWEHVDTNAQHYKSYDVLKLKGHIAGIFGHSHRAKVKQFNDVGSMFNVETDLVNINKSLITIINAGSIGQPRGTGLSYLLIKFSGDGIVAELKKFVIDLAHSESLINQSGISINAKEKLIAYLRS